MDLLGQETTKKEKSNAQKLVLMLLIFLIFIAIFVVVMIVSLQGKNTDELGMLVNGKEVELTQGMIYSDQKGVNYISLQGLSALVECDYVRGGYKEYVEDDDKCYLQSATRIIGFEANSNKIYKTIENGETDYEYFTLKNKIVKSNNMLYIAFEDLMVGNNVIYNFSSEKNKIIINTPEIALSGLKKSFEEKKLAISDNVNNLISTSYNMIIVANEAGKLGVVDSNGSSIIGHKYSTIQFDEFSQNFIVSDDGKYGVISKEKSEDNNKESKYTIKIDLKYEDVKIINYSPLLYQVKLNNKFGILNENGEVIVRMIYDRIGFPEKNNMVKSSFVVENSSDNQNFIVVCKDNKYGLFDLTEKKLIGGECELDKVYYKIDASQKNKCYVLLQNKEIELNKYLEYKNTTTVVRN